MTHRWEFTPYYESVNRAAMPTPCPLALYVFYGPLIHLVEPIHVEVDPFMGDEFPNEPTRYPCLIV